LPEVVEPPPHTIRSPSSPLPPEPTLPSVVETVPLPPYNVQVPHDAGSTKNLATMVAAEAAFPGLREVPPAMPSSAAPLTPSSPSSRPPLHPARDPSSRPPGRDPSSRPAALSREQSSWPPGREPSFLHQVPDSVRGLVRGQFAMIEGVPIVGTLDLAPLLAQRLGVQHAIIAMPGQSSRKLLQVTERVGGAFPHILVIPDLIGFASMGVPSRELAGVVGIEVRQQLLLPGPRFAKRLMDLALTMLGGIVILPIMGILALLIRIDSKGPALYTQKRLGRGGSQFTAYKFRSMHGDGEARLKAVLEANPQMRAEYEEFHKLAFDPRITRVGRFIRKYSLDELPQLLNVLKGDMSLVGPRPYLERELSDMANHEHIILRAMPGLTGLWQVGDRNSTGFAERLKMDVHYVRNWSPWLDIYVIARTFGVVLGGTGS
jgi:Undecaprenyl-phosphate galactose phosphotransferase WbaP